MNTVTRRSAKDSQELDRCTDTDDNLDNLEKCLRALEQHLKTLSQHQHLCESCVSGDDDKTKRLPTIIEGCLVDGSAQIRSNMAQNGWELDGNDSLLDLDLDSFLLANEVAEKTIHMTINGTEGVVNPIFTGDEDDRVPVEDSDKHIDNNYKCTKYINSCPDDAYNVEGVIDYKYPAPPCTDKSMACYLKSCEGQVQYQTTKDILEEIRERLNTLMLPNTLKTNRKKTTPAHSVETTAGEIPASDKSAEVDKQAKVKNDILALKHYLDNYLNLMDRQNQLEIKQFCFGLSKNYKLLTIQHALENKAKLKDALFDNSSELYGQLSSANSNHTTTDSGNHDSNTDQQIYDECKLTPSFDKRYALDNFRNGHDNLGNSRKSSYIYIGNEKRRSSASDSIRCSSTSDANFQLQRRSSSFSSSWDEEIEIVCDSNVDADDDTSAKSDDIVVMARRNKQTNLQVSKEDLEEQQAEQLKSKESHLQKNLAMQRPSLDTTASSAGKNSICDEDDMMLEWHRNKPSIWQEYYGSKRIKYSNLFKKAKETCGNKSTMVYVSNIYTIMFLV